MPQRISAPLRNLFDLRVDWPRARLCDRVFPIPFQVSCQGTRTNRRDSARTRLQERKFEVRRYAQASRKTPSKKSRTLGTRALTRPVGQDRLLRPGSISAKHGWLTATA